MFEMKIILFEKFLKNDSFFKKIIPNTGKLSKANKNLY